MRKGLKESEPGDEDRGLYEQLLSRLTEWVQQLDDTASRKRSRSVTSPPSKNKKHRAAVSTSKDVTEELHLIKGLDESLPAEASEATYGAKMDIDGAIGEMTEIEDRALSYLQDMAGIEVEVRDVDMLDEGSGEAYEGAEAWNVEFIYATAFDHLEGVEEAYGWIQQYFAATHYDHLASTIWEVSKTLRENE